MYRFSCEREERLASNVWTYHDVKQRIREDCKLRNDRTRLILKFDDDVESTPIDEDQVQKNRRLVVQRLPILNDGATSSKNGSCQRFPSARTSSIKTTGQPTPSLRKDNDSLEACRRRQPYDTLMKWNQIRRKLSKCRRVLHESRDPWRSSMNNKVTVLGFLRQIRTNLNRYPSVALDDFDDFRAAYKGTVYFARYCGRRGEHMIALERIFYGLFEQDFAI